MRRAGPLPYLLIAPAVLFLGVLFVVPLVQTIALAFHADGGWSVGNFQRMAGDLNFSAGITNTLEIVIVAVPLQLALALGMAMMLRHVGRGRDILCGSGRSRWASPTSPPAWCGSPSSMTRATSTACCSARA